MYIMNHEQAHSQNQLNKVAVQQKKAHLGQMFTLK